MNGAGGAARPWHTNDTRMLDQLSMICTVVHDESTESLDVDAFSVRGTQREITGCLIGQATNRPVGGKPRDSMLNEDRSGPCAISR